jgi:hypothetical protein
MSWRYSLSCASSDDVQLSLVSLARWCSAFSRLARSSRRQNDRAWHAMRVHPPGPPGTFKHQTSDIGTPTSFDDYGMNMELPPPLSNSCWLLRPWCQLDRIGVCGFANEGHYLRRTTDKFRPRWWSSLRWTACRMFDVLLREIFKFTEVIYIYSTLFFFIEGFLAPFIGKFKTQEQRKEKTTIFMLFV